MSLRTVYMKTRYQYSYKRHLKRLRTRLKKIEAKMNALMNIIRFSSMMIIPQYAHSESHDFSGLVFDFLIAPSQTLRNTSKHRLYLSASRLPTRACLFYIASLQAIRDP